MRFIRNPALLLASLLLAVAIPAGAAPASPHAHWVGSWAASQQLPEPQNSLAPADLRDATLRQIVHLSIGGSTLRVHLSNAFGTTPLHIASVHIAIPVSTSSDKIDVASDRQLTFAGRPSVIVPAGAEYISDPIDYPVAPLSNLAITLYMVKPPVTQTGHPGSRATSYVAHGDLVSAANLPKPQKVDHWYWIEGVDVAATASATSIVVLGDSITDGHATTTNGNNRWTDVLAEHLEQSPSTRDIGMLNEGIGGNHLLVDGLGPNALARFDRDVLAQASVHWLIVLEGVNDLGGLTRLGEVPPAAHAALVRRILAAYQQIILRAHTDGLFVIGGTIMPYTGSDYYHPTAADEADRQAVNRWIRAPGHFDAVVDFARIMRDPAHPDRLLPAYDSGDHLHPSPAGYRVMGEAVPLSLFAQ